MTIGIFAALALAIWGWSAWTAHQEDLAETEAAAERVAAREERHERILEESRGLMPEMLEGVALGMPLDQVRDARGGQMMRSGREQLDLTMYEERLRNGGQVMYGFTSGDEPRLVQVQVLSLLPTHDAIVPHLEAMNVRYGRPSGVWDCPTTGGVPTRRFTWRGSHVTVSDVFLLYGERVSLTLYIATTDQIGRSLRTASCIPVPAERIQSFPVATPEQMQAAQAGGAR